MMSTAETTNETAPNETAPVDIATMREVIGRLVPPSEVQPLAFDEVDTVTEQLRGSVNLMIVEVQALAVVLPKDDIPRYVAFACIAEARGRLERIGGTPGRYEALVYARRLARTLNALCDHYETLTGADPR
jgi:hypothetical protein